MVGGTAAHRRQGAACCARCWAFLLIYTLYKGLAFLGLAGYYNSMIRGIVLLAVVSFDAFMTRNRK